MKIAICFFSYEKDAELLNVALRGVKRLREKNPDDVFDVMVCDDAAAPMGRDAVPDWVEYVQTDFDRRGNLNGLECVQGMLQVYAGLVERGGYDWVIKMDSDTYINSLEWLREVDARSTAHVGTCYREDYGSGSCYALSAAGIAGLQVLMAEEAVQRRVDIAKCEDRVFCRLSRMTGLAVDCRCNEQNEIVPRMLYQDWLVAEFAPLELLAGAAAVCFKRCMWHTGVETYASDRAGAEVRMAAYADMMDAQDAAEAAAGEAAVEDEEVAEALGWCGEEGASFE